MDFTQSLKRHSSLQNDLPEKRIKFADNFIKHDTALKICNIIQTELDDPEINDKVFDCYIKLVTNSQIRTYFKKNIQVFNSLLKTLLHCYFTKLRDQNLALSTRCLECVNHSLDFMLDMCRISSTKEKLEKIFLEDLLYPLCVAAKNHLVGFNLKLGHLIRKLIFNKVNKPKLKDELEINNVELFIMFKKKEKKELDAETVQLSLEKIMEMAKELHDSVLLDFVFRKLVSCLSKNRSVGIEALLRCLKTETFDFAHEIGGKSMTSLLEEILSEVMEKKFLTKSDHGILSCLSEMNAVILENKCESMLVKILKDVCSKESDKNVYRDLLKLFLNVALSLKRETKFVGWLLAAVREVSKDNFQLQVSELFDHEFLSFFSKIIFRTGQKQSYNILRTLMYFLKSEVAEKINADSKGVTIMLQTVTELLVAFFNGVPMQDHLHSEPAGEKFIQTMLELRELLNDLLEISLQLEYCNTIGGCMLKLIYSWENYSWMFIEHYDHDRKIKSDDLRVDEKQIHKLVKKIMKSGDKDTKITMYEFAKYRIRSTDGKSSLIKSSSLVLGISEFWSGLLENHTEFIQSLDKSQIMELTSKMFESTLTDGNYVEKLKNCLNKGLLEDDPKLTAALTCHIFNYLQVHLKCETLKNVFTDLNFEELIETAIEDRENRLGETVSKLTDKVFESSWQQLDEEDFQKVKNCFQILHQLKIEFLSLNFKRIIFLALYSINKSCETDETITENCASMFSDLLYSQQEEFAKVVPPLFFLTDLLNPYLYTALFTKLLEKKRFVKFVKSFIHSESFESHHASTLLKCIEHATSKCVDAKAEPQLKKLYAVVCGVVLEQAKSPMTTSCEIKALTLSLKENLSTESVDETLKESVLKTLKHAMNQNFVEIGKELKVNEEDWSVLNSVKQLAMVVVQNKLCSEIKPDILKFLYKTDKIIKVKIPTLFKNFEKEDFVEYYDFLHKQLMTSYETSNKQLLTNYVSNWIDIIQADVGSSQELRMKNLTKALIAVLNFKLESEQWEPVLRYVHSIIITAKLSITRVVVDTCMMIMENCLKQCGVANCLQTLQFCSDMFTHRAEFASDRTSIIINIFENSVRHIIRESRVSGEENRTKFILYLNAMEKVVIMLHKFRKDIGRSTVYTIANIIKCYSEGFVPPFVKDSLQVCIGTILSTCDQYAIAFLRRGLPHAEQKIFDAFYNTYKMHYKFTGKI